MTRYAVPMTGTRTDREWAANRLRGRALIAVGACLIDWSVDPPALDFPWTLSSNELALLASLSTGASTATIPMAGVVTTTNAPGHPDLASHDLLGLATQAELDTHAATPHGGGVHPDEATHVSLGLIPNTDSRLTDARTPLAHSHATAAHAHPESDVTSLASDLAAKAAAVHTHAEGDVTALVSDLAGKSATGHTHSYAAPSHSHVESDTTNLTADLAAKAASVHTHAEADTTNLVADLASKAPASHSHIDSDLPAGLARDAEVAAGYSPIGHTHATSVTASTAEIDFGTLPRSDGVFNVTDAAVTPSTQILAYQSGAAATGKDADDNELDAISVRAVAKSGAFTVYADALTGPVSGRRRRRALLGRDQPRHVRRHRHRQERDGADRRAPRRGDGLHRLLQPDRRPVASGPLGPADGPIRSCPSASAPPVGFPAASMTAKQTTYAPTMGADGSLAISVNAVANGYGLEWGEMLTTGKQSFATGTVSGRRSTSGRCPPVRRRGLPPRHVGGLGHRDLHRPGLRRRQQLHGRHRARLHGATGATTQRLQTAAGATIRQYVRIQGTGRPRRGRRVRELRPLHRSRPRLTPSPLGLLPATAGFSTWKEPPWQRSQA
jgi:hypothetical protein